MYRGLLGCRVSVLLMLNLHGNKEYKMWFYPYILTFNFGGCLLGCSCLCLSVSFLLSFPGVRDERWFRSKEILGRSIHSVLTAVDTIGKCQRLAFTVGVSQHMH